MEDKTKSRTNQERILRFKIQDADIDTVIGCQNLS